MHNGYNDVIWFWFRNDIRTTSSSLRARARNQWVYDALYACTYVGYFIPLALLVCWTPFFSSSIDWCCLYTKSELGQSVVYPIYIYIYFLHCTQATVVLSWKKRRTICAKCLWARCFYLLLSKRRRRDTAFNLYFSCVKEPTVRRLTDGRMNEPNDMSVYALLCVFKRLHRTFQNSIHSIYVWKARTPSTTHSLQP